MQQAFAGEGCEHVDALTARERRRRDGPRCEPGGVRGRRIIADQSGGGNGAILGGGKPRDGRARRSFVIELHSQLCKGREQGGGSRIEPGDRPAFAAGAACDLTIVRGFCPEEERAFAEGCVEDDHSVLVPSLTLGATSLLAGPSSVSTIRYGLSCWAPCPRDLRPNA